MTVKGKIVEFDTRTWWGKVQYDLTLVDFHGTTVHGMRTGAELVGRTCDLVFNDNHHLLAVWLTS